jgi:putative heme-binding domain-containing protein
VSPSELSLYDRQRLAQSPNAEISKYAAALLPASADAGARADVVARYASVARLTGDATKGTDLFAANCAACHALGGVGHDVGPNLAALRDKDVDYFVKNVLDPGAVVEPRFVNYVVVTKDGRTLSGVIKSETETALTLGSGGGAADAVSRGNVKEIRATGGSMMPEGFEAALTPQQMADLVAFLKLSAVGPRKEFPGNAPELVTASADGSLVLPATKAEIYGGQVAFETEFKNIGMWTGEGDSVAWTARVEKAGDYDVYLDYACADNSAGNKFRLTAGGQTFVAPVAATGPDWSRYRRERVVTFRLEAGMTRVTVRPESQPRNALMDLRAVILAPAGAPPREPVPAAK